jgi:hypothetical protein
MMKDGKLERVKWFNAGMNRGKVVVDKGVGWKICLVESGGVGILYRGGAEGLVELAMRFGWAKEEGFQTTGAARLLRERKNKPIWDNIS